MNGIGMGSLAKRVAALELQRERSQGLVRVLTLAGLYGAEPAAEYVRADQFKPMSLVEFYEEHGT